MQINSISRYSNNFSYYQPKNTAENSGERESSARGQSVASRVTDSKTIFTDKNEKAQDKNQNDGFSGLDEKDDKKADGKKTGDKKADPNKECQTCKNRKYVDGSDDPGVSFKTPSKIKPEAAASMVKQHEMQHVSRNKAKAQAEKREIVSQSVTMHTGVCPECGKVYVSGGTTYTVTKNISKNEFAAELDDARGENVDLSA